MKHPFRCWDLTLHPILGARASSPATIAGEDARAPRQPNGQTTKRMDINLILTVVLASTMIVVVLALVCVIIYYRWQLGDKNATLGRFIDENAELRRKIRRAGMC